MKSVTTVLPTAVLSFCFAIAASSQAAEKRVDVRNVVDVAVQPVMAKYAIPGMAVGVVVAGKSYVFDYGVTSKETRRPVTPSTIFEIGSISKTFATSLASLAQVKGHLSLSDPTSAYLPSMRGTAFGDVSLIHLATHTAGGFPLQVPDNVKNNDQLITYFQQWKPSYEAGTIRTYANPSIGMLGTITAISMKQDYTALMEGQLFPALGLTSTYINVPASKMADYAQGYTRRDEPARITPGLLSAEAYGVRTTATDLIRFVQANMKMIKLDEKLQRAITDTHTGYFKAGVMTQDMAWEQYAYPVGLETLLHGNSYEMINKPTPVTPFTPPLTPRDDVLINKTGSTNGFGAYVAFVPAKQIGVVILANKNYPIEDRVTIAHQVLSRLVAKTGSDD